MLAKYKEIVSLICAGENLKWCTHSGKYLKVSYKIKHSFTIQPRIPGHLK